VCRTIAGLTITFFVVSGEKLMKLVPAAIISKRILKSVCVVEVQLGLAVVLQLPPGPTVAPIRA
jgi:hypothetical protein